MFPVEALVSDLHPSAEGANWRKILNREADCLSGRREMAPYESGTRSTLALCHEQFGWLSVVEGHDLFIPKRALNLLQCLFGVLFLIVVQLHTTVVVCLGILEAWLRHRLVREPINSKSRGTAGLDWPAVPSF